MVLDSWRQFGRDSLVKYGLNLRLLDLIFHAQAQNFLVLNIVEMLRVILEYGRIAGDDLELVLGSSLAGFGLFLADVAKLIK